MTSPINTDMPGDSRQEPEQQPASTAEKTKFLPLILSGGRVTVAPFVKWENLGEALGDRDPSIERQERLEKAAALRSLAADLIEQAQGIESSLTATISPAAPQLGSTDATPAPKRPRP